jgi:hypothetical protein
MGAGRSPRSPPAIAPQFTFTGELFSLAQGQVANLLCLTGDWRVGRPMVNRSTTSTRR